MYTAMYVHTHAYLPLSTEDIPLSARISLELPARAQEYNTDINQNVYS